MLGKVQLPRRAQPGACRVHARYSGEASKPRGAGGRGGRSQQPGRGGGGRGPSPELFTQLQYAGQFWSRLFSGLPSEPAPPRQLPNGRAARPAHSTAGKTIEVLTNHVPLNVGVRVVHQYDVRISRVRDAVPGSTASSGQQGSGQGGGKPGRARRDARVSGQEAHAVLSTLLAGAAGASPAGAAGGEWVFDGSQALYSVEGDLRRRAAAAAASAGGVGGDGELQLQLAAAPAAGVVGGTYKVELKLVAALDVAQCLKEATQPPAPQLRTSPPDEEQSEGFLEPAGLPPPLAAPSPSPRAAALAVLDLVTRAEVAWDSDSVRTGAGSFMSYRLEDPLAPVKGLLQLKLLRGFRSAVAQVAAGTTLTIDAASAVVAGDGPLLGQLQAALAEGRNVSALAAELGNTKNSRRLEEALVGLEVQPSYSANRYKLSGKLGKSARSYMFESDGRKISVETYFKERYGITLRHPDLPCVLDKKGGALPIELLSVVKYQKRMSRLDSRQKAAYIRTAALKPADRMRAMREALARQLGSVGGRVARTFGLAPLSTRPEFLKVPAQLLPGPLLQVARQQAVEPGNKAPLQRLLTALDKALSASSASPLPRDIPIIWASAPKPGLSPDKAAADAEFWLKRAAAKAEEAYKQPSQMVIVVLPDKGGVGLYDAIKAAGDGKLGLATQVVNPAKAGLAGPGASSGPSPSYAAQLALSVNAKLGGATTRPAGRPQDWLPLLRGQRLMVLGADISRGAAAALSGRGGDQQLAAAEAESEAQVSAGVEYAAVVASVDSHAVDYRVQLSAQVAGNRDIVVSMRESVRRLLLQYGVPQGKEAAAAPRPVSELPEVLLMYRDGLSESQFDAALAEEFTAIVQACTDAGGPSYRPRISFVVVQKSHNTRFFPTSNEFTHKSGNVLPGTAVDRGVTDPHAFDFFLNSHAGIQGTNRAPRYTALVDEVGFTAEALQLLTHTLCHTYPACTRALSLPPAVRYADRAADRARALRHTVARPSGKQGRGVGWYDMLPSLAHAGHVV
ncbi:hypothetical protein HXX76_015466 [Chlamydomonas incerta]|uniref:Argonaute-like protein n=1 Tax=Chlamydomonas incerta TaxID=51695 RepID=A0A835VRK0_CHLIN|nr:hypothetical protein HXX76_015466 [Chlamydomonas incerta]|eukprot:KAG2423208.1 hypothetical protein HXX76_015466 [Chlamydomonas incerta]